MKNLLLLMVVCLVFAGCKNQTKKQEVETDCVSVVHPEWSRNAVMYEVNIRQYSQEGTFSAVEKQLPQLKELGVDILWLMPIFPISELNRKGTLGSYYAVKNYKEVNPEFGTLDEFKSLVNTAHQMGFKVILDWVANHTGCDNAWTKEHPEWYVRDDKGNFTSPYDWTDTYKLDYSNQDMRTAMTDALKYWVAECDVDGYRCDVAYEVPVDFWDNVRVELDSIKPVFMLAEAEHADLTNKAFDMVYNWPMKDLFNAIAKGDTASHSRPSGIIIPSGVKNTLNIDSLVAQQIRIFPCDAYQMNMITNHDLNSWEGTEYDRLGAGVPAFAVLSYILPGMPLIYSGQEVGLNRAIKFFEKDPILSWEKNETFAFYQKLNQLKHSHPALKAGIEGGELKRINNSEDAKVAIYSREKNGQEIVAIFNLSSEPVTYTLSKPMRNVSYTDYFTQQPVTEFPLSMDAWGYKVLVK